MLEDVGLELTLLELECILLHRVVGLGEAVLCIPAGVRSHVDSLLGLVEIIKSLFLQSTLGMSEHIRTEFLSFSFFAIDGVTGRNILNSLILVDIGLMRVSPVSLRSHQRTITLSASMHGLFTIELFHFAILGSLVGDNAGGSLTLESTSEVLLLLPCVGLLLITVKTTTAGITALQVLSMEIFGLGSSENLALPILLLTSRDRMMQHAITKLIGSWIVAQHVRARISSLLTLTNSLVGAS